MGQYAASTEVSTEKSLAEVRNTLLKYGATGFLFGEHNDPPRAFLEFEMQGRRIRFVVPMPRRKEYERNSYGNLRPDTAINKDWQQGIRQRWRSLALVVKAKLVAVEDDIVSFEQEFAMHFVMSNGATVYEQIQPHLPAICETSKLPALMPAPGGKS